MTIALTANQRRQIAREVQASTHRLQKAIGKGHIEGVRTALDEGALPEWATFANKKGTSLGSAISRALRHKNLELLELLIAAQAPLLGEANKSALQVAVQLGFPDGFARLARDIPPSDDDWRTVLEAGMPYVALLHSQHSLDFSRPLKSSSIHWPALFHIADPRALEYVVSQGADPEIGICVKSKSGNIWKPLEWAVASSKGLEDEKDEMIKSTFGVSANQLGLELMGTENPLELLKAYARAGAQITQKAFVLALQKGYPDVLVWMLEENQTFRIKKNIEGLNAHDPSTQLSRRPHLHRYLLVEQERIDLERSTLSPTGHNTAGPRL